MKYNEEYIDEIRKIYLSIKNIIKARLKEFKEKNDYEKKLELLFCILTPQSKAKICWDSVCKISKSDIFNLKKEEIKECLNGVRFPNNKTKYIIEAINFLKMNPGFIKNLENMDEKERREYIVKRFKGIGFKEASHFLRNIGLGENLAILDRHILKNLLKLNVIDEIPKTLTRKKYLEIEEKMEEFSKYSGIPMEELDLLLWFKETGEVFK